jgi:hypothetical protein
MFVCAFQISWISIMKTLYYEITSATFLQNFDAKFMNTIKICKLR